MVMDYPDYWKPIAWVEQYGDLWPMRDWVAKLGKLKIIADSIHLAAGEAETVTLYTVPEGYELYLSSVNQGSDVKGGVRSSLYPGPMILRSFHQPYTTHSLPLGCSTVAQAGVQVRVLYQNDDTVGGRLFCYIIGFELGGSSPGNPEIQLSSERYKRGKWNYSNIERDDTRITTYQFSSIGEPRIIRFKAKILYTPEGEVLEDEEV